MILPHDEVGSGPAIVLLHAGVADRRMWRAHLEPLAAAGYRAVAVDLPGFGEMPELEDSVAWALVTQTMDGLGLDLAVLVGNSWGGGVALRTAAVAPHRVSGLVLVSARPFGAPPSPQLAHASSSEEEAFNRGDLDGAVEAVLEAWTLPESPPAVRELVAEMQRRALELQSGTDEPREPPDPLSDGPGILAAFDIPALILDGEHDMPDFHDAADLLAGGLPKATRVTIPGAGHLSPLETPQAFRELLLAFLGELRVSR
jgi:pimeloyl-ACP methyl ester carboxylesterase